MFFHALDAAARRVVANYFFDARSVRLEPLGNAGGFSGARLWRCEGPSTRSCLRAWPPGAMTPERLAGVHRLMARAVREGLRFVPQVLPARAGATWVACVDRL